MEPKAEREGEGAPRGPVLHIVVVGFHHKKGCQVRRREARRGEELRAGCRAGRRAGPCGASRPRPEGQRALDPDAAARPLGAPARGAVGKAASFVYPGRPAARGREVCARGLRPLPGALPPARPSVHLMSPALAEPPGIPRRGCIYPESVL